MRSIVVVAHNLRSTHNIGSLLRTADGMEVEKVYLTGYTPYPINDDDLRLPYLAKKIHQQIAKTALGAESLANWEHADNVSGVLQRLRDNRYLICALEQTDDAIRLPDFAPPQKIALVVGREVEGIEPEILLKCDKILEIPMLGNKESYNVVQTAAMALYHCRYFKV